MTYECEFIGGYVSPVVTVSRLPDYMIGMARDGRGYKRVLFYSAAAHSPDPWVAAIRPCDAAARYRLQQIEPAPGPGVDVTG